MYPARVSVNVRKCHKTEAQARRSAHCAAVEPDGGRRRPCRQNHTQNALSMAERAGFRRGVQAGAPDGIRAMHRAAPAGLRRSRFGLAESADRRGHTRGGEGAGRRQRAPSRSEGQYIEDIEARVADLERAAGSARGPRKSSVVVEWTSTKALPGPAATPAQMSPAARLLAAPREAAMNDDTDQSQAHERVSDTELELRPISPEAQKAKPKGPNGG
jgi:hypothetical protein